MKKIIALTLVICTLAFLFVACTDNNDPAVTTKPGDTTAIPIEGFTSVNETVYVIAENGLNVRSTPEVVDGTDNKVGSLAYGKEVVRTGINEVTGWSRIMYNNEVAYVKSEYLSANEPGEITTVVTDTDVPDTNFVACNDETVIYTTVVDEKTNEDIHKEGEVSTVYSAPNKSKPTTTLKDGTAVTRIAVYYENENDHTYGWSKIQVVVEGETLTYFIRNSQLKIEMVKE